MTDKNKKKYKKIKGFANIWSFPRSYFLKKHRANESLYMCSKSCPCMKFTIDIFFKAKCVACNHVFDIAQQMRDTNFTITDKK